MTVDSKGRVTDVHLKQSWRHAVGEQALGAREERQFNTDFDGDNWPAATAAGEWKAD